jgi:hypothetical protein
MVGVGSSSLFAFIVGVCFQKQCRGEALQGIDVGRIMSNNRLDHIYVESPMSVRPEVHRSIVAPIESDREDSFVIARIQALGTYENGWDGPESVAPMRSTVEDAEGFARYLFSIESVRLPHIGASSDGEINFYWKNDRFLLDLGFDGDGYYSYYARLPNGGEIIENGASLAKPLPQEIIDLIRKTA